MAIVAPDAPSTPIFSKQSGRNRSLLALQSSLNDQENIILLDYESNSYISSEEPSGQSCTDSEFYRCFGEDAAAQSGSAVEDDSQSPKKKRTRTSPEQLLVLQKAFITDPMPSSSVRNAIATSLGMTPRAVQVWFQNRRAKGKQDLKRIYHINSTQPHFHPHVHPYSYPYPHPVQMGHYQAPGQFVNGFCLSNNPGPSQDCACCGVPAAQQRKEYSIEPEAVCSILSPPASSTPIQEEPHPIAPSVGAGSEQWQSCNFPFYENYPISAIYPPFSEATSQYPLRAEEDSMSNSRYPQYTHYLGHQDGKHAYQSVPLSFSHKQPYYPVPWVSQHSEIYNRETEGTHFLSPSQSPFEISKEQEYRYHSYNPNMYQSSSATAKGSSGSTPASFGDMSKDGSIEL